MVSHILARLQHDTQSAHVMLVPPLFLLLGYELLRTYIEVFMNNAVLGYDRTSKQFLSLKHRTLDQIFHIFKMAWELFGGGWDSSALAS